MFCKKWGNRDVHDTGSEGETAGERVANKSTIEQQIAEGAQ